MSIEGFILAGGASSRMGEDKSLLRLDGRTFVESAADALRSVSTSVGVVSSRHEAETHGLPLVRDLHAGLGALGGLHAALASCRAEWAAILACDLPFMTGQFFERLASMRNDGLDAIVPIQEDGRVQPLSALYRARVCLEQLEEMIRTNELRPRLLVSRVRSRRVRFEELRGLKDSSRLFLNVNTHEDYRRALGEYDPEQTKHASVE